ncbi:unnamed protein product, partial [Brassica oleracea]
NYRLAGEKKNVNSVEKKLALSNSDADEKKRKKGWMHWAIQLTMQMEVQNQLHEQLLEVTPITLYYMLLQKIGYIFYDSKCNSVLSCLFILY